MNRPPTIHCIRTLAASLAIVGMALGFNGALWAAELGGGGMRQPMGAAPPPMRPSFPGSPPPGPTRGDPGHDTIPRQMPPPKGLISAPPGSAPPEERGRRTDSASITHRGTRYLVSDGRWYEQRGDDLIAVAPPAGVLVESLPDGYSMRWVGGVPYFYADGLYYVWRERSRRYEILKTAPNDERAPAGEARSEADREGAP